MLSGSEKAKASQYCHFQSTMFRKAGSGNISIMISRNAGTGRSGKVLDNLSDVLSTCISTLGYHACGRNNFMIPPLY